MASRLADRLLTIVITATVTSAAWVVIGGSYVDLDRADSFATPMREKERAAVGARPGLPATQPSRAQVSQLLIPVLNVPAAALTSTHSDARDEGKELHEAIDIMAPAGTPVVAAGPGTIERLFLSEAGGHTIYVRSSDRRTLHYYAHLQGYSPGLKEGQQIRRGQRLGEVGSSGNADPAAPHLHFAILRTAPDAEWWEPGSALDPYPLLGDR